MSAAIERLGSGRARTWGCLDADDDVALERMRCLVSCEVCQDVKVDVKSKGCREPRDGHVQRHVQCTGTTDVDGGEPGQTHRC